MNEIESLVYDHSEVYGVPSDAKMKAELIGQMRRTAAALDKVRDGHNVGHDVAMRSACVLLRRGAAMLERS